MNLSLEKESMLHSWMEIWPLFSFLFESSDIGDYLQSPLQIIVFTTSQLQIQNPNR
jgi:hypothetical protein